MRGTAHALSAVSRSTLRARLRSLGLAAFVVSLAALSLAAAPASADRLYDSQITGFQRINAVTVDSSGNVWVVDNNNNGLISEFNPYPSQTLLGQQSGGGHFGSGAYLWGVAVGSLNHYLYAANSSPVELDIFDNTGNYVSNVTSFSSYYLFVAAAPSGDIYVDSSADHKIEKFDANGNPANFSGSASYISGNTITGTPSASFNGKFNTPWGMTTDASGNIYVINPSAPEIDEFDSSGIFVRAIDGTGVPGAPKFSGSSLNGVAVDPTNGDVLVTDSNHRVVDEFDSTGNYIGQITGTGEEQATPFGSLFGIAVNSSGYVYVTDGSKVDIFTNDRILPKVSYSPVTNLAHTSATVNGNVDLNGGPNVTSCEFQYGTTTAYGSSAPCSPGTLSSNGPVSGDITGLTAEQTYHYRLVVTTSQGTRKGADQTFYPQAVYDLSTDPATNLVNGAATSGSGATLNASFTGDSTPTTYYFEYASISDYNPSAPDPYSAGQVTPTPAPISPSGPQGVSADVTGLTAGTPYHYRVVSNNQFGTSYGADQTFVSKAPSPPIIDATDSSNVARTSATLNTTVNPNFGSTVVRFEYGPSSAYGSRTYPTDSIGDDNVDHSASVDVADLLPGTTYHFRALVTNLGGTTKGPDRSFTTPDLPAISTGDVSGLAPTAVTLNAQVIPGLRSTTYHFEYGITDAYGTSTPESAPVGSDLGTYPASAALTGLVPGVTYHYRVVATNSVGTTDGPDQSFTTPLSSPVITPPPVRCQAGFVLRQGKCVKKHARKHHHKRRHHKRSAAHA